MWNTQDLTGKRFGRLVAIERAESRISPSGNKTTRWKCKCDCGNYTIVDTASLNRCTKSCGCLQKESFYNVITKHGQSGTRLHRIWKGLMIRCYNSNHHTYKNYGGRGITVCGEWKQNFKAFYDWAVANGYDENLSLDRIDTNGNYSPENCRWATQLVQANNTNKNHYLTFNGKTMTIAQWSRETGIPYRRLLDRINRLKWSTEKALQNN